MYAEEMKMIGDLHPTKRIELSDAFYVSECVQYTKKEIKEEFPPELFHMFAPVVCSFVVNVKIHSIFNYIL